MLVQYRHWSWYRTRDRLLGDSHAVVREYRLQEPPNFLAFPLLPVDVFGEEDLGYAREELGGLALVVRVELVILSFAGILEASR